MRRHILHRHSAPPPEPARRSRALLSPDKGPFPRDRKLLKGWFWYRDCLATSEVVPIFWTHSMPWLMVGNIFMIAASHVSYLADLFIQVSSEGRGVNLPSVLEFSLGATVKTMLYHKCTGLAVLLLVFSGVFPYSKSLLTFSAWMLPPQLLSVRRRGQIVKSLDMWGKWSLLDIFVLNFITIGLYTSKAIAMAKATTLGIMVNPRFGFHVFVIALIMQLILGHLVLFYHEKSPEAKELVNWDVHQRASTAAVRFASSSRSTRSYTTRFSVHVSPRDAEASDPTHDDVEPDDTLPDEALRKPDKTKKIVRRGRFKTRWHMRKIKSCWLRAGPGMIDYGVSVALVVGFVFNWVGSLLPLFSFQIQGMLKVVLQSLNPNDSSTQSTYSLLSLGERFQNALVDPSTFGAVVIQASYFTFSFITPVLFGFVLLCLWHINLQPDKKKNTLIPFKYHNQILIFLF